MKKNSVLLTIAILFTVVFLGWAGCRIYKSIIFDFQCGAFLKRAAEANTVEIAKEELAKALEYIEEQELTSGIVSIFLRNPSNDVSFWYNNISAAQDELMNLPEDATALERTNVLMKLRESLTDRSDGNTAVTHPAGISVYPHNVLYFWWGLISLVGVSTFWTWWGINIGLIKVEETKKK